MARREDRRLRRMNNCAGSPAVSVIIPTFNAADTIIQQLEALAGQDLDRPWEVLVCDNGSTDSTVSVVRSWMVDRDRFNLVDASHRRGPSAARNCGAAVATAPLLAFCDADDVVESSWLSAMVEALEHADAVAGVVEASLLTTGRMAMVSWTTQAPISLDFWPEYPAGATNNLAVRAAVFHAIDGFDESLAACEDIDFCWRLQAEKFTFATCSAAVVTIRKRHGRRAVFQQARNYGRGEGLLRRKWTEHARIYAIRTSHSERRGADEARHVGTASMRSVRTGAVVAIQRGWRVVANVGSPAQQANLLWRCGFSLGLQSAIRETRTLRWRE